MNPVLKRTVTGLAVGGCVIASVLTAPVEVLAAVCLVLFVLSEIELYRLCRIPPQRAKAFLAFAFFTLLLAGLFGFLPHVAASRGNVLLLCLIAVVKFSDVGGFAFGLTSARLMKGGNHKLCPTVSPNKSWEGFAGSIVCSCIVSCIFLHWTHFGVAKTLGLGVAAAFIGTFGDLVESKFKRWVGVKDSSTMKATNGLGGFLDMFDSLLFSPMLAVLM